MISTQALAPRLERAKQSEDDDASLIGKRGPHLWRRGDPAEERRKAQRRGRADKCR